MTDSLFLMDRFLTTKPGEPYRLFPFGWLSKGGKKREITPEFASSFHLPHFKPPIKLGSHNEETPAGGHIIALEVRDDGLYAIPEFVESGVKALQDGAYRYHSPEIIWEGGLEDPQTGKLIPGPFIVGDALLHTPHLGEAAALYSITQEEHMTDQVTMPAKMLDKFIDLFKSQKQEDPKPELQPDPEKPEVVELDAFKAIEKERDDYKARIEALETAKEKEEKMNALVIDLQDKEKFGAVYADPKAAKDDAEMLFGMTDEQREWTITKFKAFIAQIDESAITGEKGSDAADTEADPQEKLNAVVLSIAKEKNISYNAAVEVVRAEKPELFVFNSKEE